LELGYRRWNALDEQKTMVISIIGFNMDKKKTKNLIPHPFKRTIGEVRLQKVSFDASKWLQNILDDFLEPNFQFWTSC